MNQHKRLTLTSTRARADLDHFLYTVDLDPFVIIFQGVDWMSPFADEYHEGPSASKMLVQMFVVAERAVPCSHYCQGMGLYDPVLPNHVSCLFFVSG